MQNKMEKKPIWPVYVLYTSSSKERSRYFFGKNMSQSELRILI